MLLLCKIVAPSLKCMQFVIFYLPYLYQRFQEVNADTNEANKRYVLGSRPTLVANLKPIVSVYLGKV